MSAQLAGLSRRASENAMQNTMRGPRSKNKWTDLFVELALLGVTSCVSLHLVNRIMNQHSPFGSAGQTSKRDRKRLIERLNRPSWSTWS